jgi:magnesium transporter
MNQWLGLKRDILRIERILIKSSETSLELIKQYTNQPSFPKDHYADLHEHLDRVMRSATVQLSKLDYLYSFYNARTSEKMNKMVYILTIISAVFLPLNLVVGFFGMNTSGLPFAKGENGTLNAVFMMGVLLVISLFFGYIYKKMEKEKDG